LVNFNAVLGIFREWHGLTNTVSNYEIHLQMSPQSAVICGYFTKKNRKTDWKFCVHSLAFIVSAVQWHACSCQSALAQGAILSVFGCYFYGPFDIECLLKFCSIS